MSNSGPRYDASSACCVSAVMRPTNRLTPPSSSAARLPPTGPTVFTSMVTMSGPPMLSYHRWSKSRWTPLNTAPSRIGTPRVSSGSAALITRLLTAVLKNCAANTFSAMFFCSSMNESGRSKWLTACTIIFSPELTMVTAATARKSSAVSNDPGARRNTSHCSRKSATSLSDIESSIRSPLRCVSDEVS